MVSVCAVATMLAPTAARAAGGVAVTDPNAVSIVQSVPSTKQWLTPEPGVELTPGAPTYGYPVITINDAQRDQTVQGFGGAMTDSSAWLIEDKLSPTARATLMGELFGPTGIHLDFVRVAIGASDFTVGGKPYSYDDLPAGQTDPELTHFSIKHDQAYILPALRQALALNHSTELLASPWTPPAWMKRNDSLGNAGNEGTLRAADYGPWAQYIVKFLQAYAAAGVPIEAITPQNEPGNATSYPGLNMSLNSLATWTDSDLVPALRQARLKPRVYGLDIGWGSAALADQLASGETSEISGVAWHCYYGSPDVMGTLHLEQPRVQQIVDECSPGITPISTTEVVISSLRNWASTVALWNLALDPTGGPVQQPNRGCPGCYGLATINEATGAVTLTSAYYELAQASMAIESGAHVVSSTNFVSYDYLKPGVNFITPSLDDVAVVNPDGTRVLLAYNNGPAPVTFAVEWHGKYFDDTLPARATATFTWDQ
jgi:glucosylceramidase